MLDRLARHSHFCFLDGYSGYNQIAIAPEDQKKTTFTCPFGTFAFRRMPFGLCNASGTFQRCMMSIFFDLAEEVMEIFMDDFYHTPIPGPTRLADPNRVRGTRSYTGTFFFFKAELVHVGMAHIL